MKKQVLCLLTIFISLDISVNQISLSKAYALPEITEAEVKESGTLLKTIVKNLKDASDNKGVSAAK